MQEVVEHAISTYKAVDAAHDTRVLTEGAIQKLLCSALSVEVDCPDLLHSLFDLLKLQKWVARAEHAFSHGKHTADGLAKILKEGEALGVSFGSCSIAKRMQQRVNAAHRWQEKAKRVMHGLKVSPCTRLSGLSSWCGGQCEFVWCTKG